MAEKKVVKVTAKAKAAERYPGLRTKLLKFPYPIVIVAFYVFLGFLAHLWHPMWLLFLTIPAYYQLTDAVGKSTEKGFLLALPVVPVSVILYLIAGFALHLWKYAWIIFILDLIYYWYIGTYKNDAEDKT
ncbi:MAG: hypothetical protein IJ766_01560 [Clostridia bacterium]|nr:hypothetical protein [Clostridia bacterium]